MKEKGVREEGRSEGESVDEGWEDGDVVGFERVEGFGRGGEGGEDIGGSGYFGKDSSLEWFVRWIR